MHDGAAADGVAACKLTCEGQPVRDTYALIIRAYRTAYGSTCAYDAYGYGMCLCLCVRVCVCVSACVRVCAPLQVSLRVRLRERLRMR
jgi:hypothetical protein